MSAKQNEALAEMAMEVDELQASFLARISQVENHKFYLAGIREKLQRMSSEMYDKAGVPK
jgi:hypothetical protein